MKFIKKLKEKDIDVAILILLMILVPIFIVQLSVGDELWNFAFIYKMNLGYQPYSDLNIIITPIFHILGLIILKVFGANFLAFRIYNLIIIFTLLFLVFKILKSLKINKKNIILTIILAVYIFGAMFSEGANYNMLAFIPILTSLLMLVNDKKNYFLHGFLIIITILIKQNIGVYFGIGLVTYVLIERKNVIKNLFNICIVNITGGLFFAFVLYEKGIIDDFYFYAISGVGQFSSYNIHISYAVGFVIAIAIVNVILAYFLKRSKIKEKNVILENIKKIYCIGIPLVLVGYPIFNLYHIYLSMFVLLIGYSYIINIMFANEILTDKMYKIIIIVLILFVLIQNIMLVLINFKGNAFIKNKESAFYGAITSNIVLNHIERVCDFIEESEKQGINTIVLTPHSNLYMVPLKKNNKNGMDLPFNGNLGYAGEEGLIEKIDSLKNTFVLIVKDEEELFWQESKKVREYIQKDWEKIGVIEIFDVYYK